MRVGSIGEVIVAAHAFARGEGKAPLRQQNGGHFRARLAKRRAFPAAGRRGHVGAGQCEGKAFVGRNPGEQEPSDRTQQTQGVGHAFVFARGPGEARRRKRGGNRVLPQRVSEQRVERQVGSKEFRRHRQADEAVHFAQAHALDRVVHRRHLLAALKIDAVARSQHAGGERRVHPDEGCDVGKIRLGMPQQFLQAGVNPGRGGKVFVRERDLLGRDEIVSHGCGSHRHVCARR